MTAACLLAVAGPPQASDPACASETFEGTYFTGQGDVEYLQLLDYARRMFAPDPELQNVAMLYTPAWNGFVEGPTWGAWWIQNSYGPTYCALPLLDEPLSTFLQNAQDLWFDQMGDGQRTWTHDGQELVIPDGQLCDAASPGWVVPKQGDGRVGIHDWGVEFTAAGLVMQAELLLISRDEEAIARYLPKLRRCADLLESRRDPANNLFLAGPAGNLLAPSYAGWKRPDGTYDKAYLAGLSITYIAALDRLIELEKLAGDPEAATTFVDRRARARLGLPQLTTDEGYFVKYLDPDGTRHGVYGADQHGYFEAVVNHDALCFRVADDAQSARIYAKIASIPGLRPHDFIITNYPGLDDMYEPPTSWLWQFGTWVNGGHWSTCEARMIMGYYRLGQHDDARRSMQQLMTFARDFRMDNPLVEFGARVYQPNQPINLCYDSFGPPAALVRGLFEYRYSSRGLTLSPHVPPGITQLQQHFPIRFGRKRLYLATTGSGPVSGVFVNGQPWSDFDAHAIQLPYDQTPVEAVIEICLGGAVPAGFVPRHPDAAAPLPEVPALASAPWSRQQFPVMATNELPLRIGADSSGGSRFVGHIGRVQIYRRALSAAEVEAVARATTAQPDAERALVADWQLGAAQDKVVANACGDTLPAHVVGDCPPCDAPGGGALQLTGQGFLEVAHDPRLDLVDGGTICAWICPQQQGAGGGRIVDKCTVGAANGYVLDTFPGNALRLITERAVLTCDAGLPPDVWVHVAATVDAEGELALYVDGRRIAHRAGGEPTPELAELDARIAHLRRFHGSLVAAGLSACYEAAHARLAVEYLATTCRRFELLAAGEIAPLEGASQYAADKSYLLTVSRLCTGLEQAIVRYADSQDAHQQQIVAHWDAAKSAP
ncbi:MAG: LamG domain-containing protein [Pirellulaceae bacterium]|nr:LamG domain-containing protein [Pirellulaceae bacterium]